MNGQEYKAAPYTDVQAIAMAMDNSIPSGSTVVNGAYFSWNENGFVGTGWYITDGSPLKNAGITDDTIGEYLENNGNLNQVFADWHPSFDEFMNWADNFREGGPGTGCADFDISVQQ